MIDHETPLLIIEVPIAIVIALVAAFFK